MYVQILRHGVMVVEELVPEKYQVLATMTLLIVAILQLGLIQTVVVLALDKYQVLVMIVMQTEERFAVEPPIPIRMVAELVLDQNSRLMGLATIAIMDKVFIRVISHLELTREFFVHLEQ